MSINSQIGLHSRSSMPQATSVPLEFYLKTMTKFQRIYVLKRNFLQHILKCNKAREFYKSWRLQKIQRCKNVQKRSQDKYWINCYLNVCKNNFHGFVQPIHQVKKILFPPKQSRGFKKNRTFFIDKVNEISGF